MGEIFVEGIGLIQIQGEEPTPEEMGIIEENLLAGTPEAKQEVDSKPRPAPVQTPSTPEEGLGLVSPETRKEVRETVESFPTIAQFGAEVAPAMLGTIAGAGAGALTGPFAPVAVPLLAAAGGLLFEFLAQETGVAPPSGLALGLSAAAPLGGPIFGGMLKLGRLAIGPGAAKLPPIAMARARIMARKAVGAFDSLGGRILAKQKGLLGRTSEELFKKARGTVPKIEVDDLQGTISALGKLRQELSQVAAIPEAAQALALVNQSIGILVQKGGVSFNTFIEMEQMIGRIIRRTEKVGGLKLGTSKQVFKGMADDIDVLANKFSPGRGARKGIRAGARVTQVAAQRAKLEFSIRSMERATAKFITNVPEKDDLILDVGKLRKWVLDVTSPKSEAFDKNFSSALRKELPGIKTALKSMETISKATGSSAGPGSIIIRGVGARQGRALVGGLVGFGTAGPIGGAIGGLAGASVPEMITALFMTKGGAAILNQMVKLGKGDIPVERWAILTQFLVKAAQFESTASKQPSTVPPLESRRKEQEDNLGIPPLSSL